MGSQDHGVAHDGRLDLDALGSAPATGLDVIATGDDAPGLGDRVAAALERHGVTPWTRAHRGLTVAIATVVVLAVGATGLWWLTRPVPLPDVPRVAARAGGQDPTATYVFDTTGKHPVAVRQAVRLTSTERPGVAIEALGLRGPGVRPVSAAQPVDEHGTAFVSAAVDCASPQATTAALAARDNDYSVVLRRTAPEGESRTDAVPLAEGGTLAGLVRTACLQEAVDRDLHVTSVSTSTIPGAIAADLDVAVTNVGTQTWGGLVVSPGAQPVLVKNGPVVTLAPGAAGHLRVRLTPLDCGSPQASLLDGIPVRPVLEAPGGAPSPVTVLLALPAASIPMIARSFATSCGPEAVTLQVVSARIRGNPTDVSAGFVDLLLDLHVPGTTSLDADHLDDIKQSSRLIAQESPVPVVGGRALLAVRWVLPTCDRLVREGLPRLHLVAAGTPPRPFVVALHGAQLRPALAQSCSLEAADLAG